MKFTISSHVYVYVAKEGLDALDRRRAYSLPDACAETDSVGLYGEITEATARGAKKFKVQCSGRLLTPNDWEVDLGDIVDFIEPEYKGNGFVGFVSKEGCLDRLVLAMSQKGYRRGIRLQNERDEE